MVTSALKNDTGRPPFHPAGRAVSRRRRLLRQKAWPPRVAFQTGQRPLRSARPSQPALRSARLSVQDIRSGGIVLDRRCPGGSPSNRETASPGPRRPEGEGCPVSEDVSRVPGSAYQHRCCRSCGGAISPSSVGGSSDPAGRHSGPVNAGKGTVRVPALFSMMTRSPERVMFRVNASCFETGAQARPG